MKKILMLIMLTLTLILGACTSDNANETDVEKVEPKKVETSAPAVKEKIEPKGVSLQSYIDDTVDPLVNSVTANIDTNWGFYMIEPFERLEAGGNLESFQGDIELLGNLFNGVIQQIDESETPDHFSAEEIKNINEVKSELKMAVSKRIEVADVLLEKNSSGDVLNTDVIKQVDASNEHLQKAGVAYSRLISK